MANISKLILDKNGNSSATIIKGKAKIKICMMNKLFI